MNKTLKKILLIMAIIFALLSLFGCASGGGLGGQTYYDPIEQECSGVARNASGMGANVVSDGLVGALVAAGTGAAVGAIASGGRGAAKGAMIGGTVGGVGGAGYGAYTSNVRYQQVFNECVRQKKAAYGQQQYGYSQQQGYYGQQPAPQQGYQQPQYGYQQPQYRRY